MENRLSSINSLESQLRNYLGVNDLPKDTNDSLIQMVYKLKNEHQMIKESKRSLEETLKVLQMELEEAAGKVEN